MTEVVFYFRRDSRSYAPGRCNRMDLGVKRWARQVLRKRFLCSTPSKALDSLISLRKYIHKPSSVGAEDNVEDFLAGRLIHGVGGAREHGLMYFKTLFLSRGLSGGVHRPMVTRQMLGPSSREKQSIYTQYAVDVTDKTTLLSLIHI